MFDFIKNVYNKQVFKYKLNRRLKELLTNYCSIYKVNIFPAFATVNEQPRVSILQTVVGVDAVRMEDLISYTPDQFIETFKFPDENGDIYLDDGTKVQHIDYLIPEGHKYVMALYNYILQDKNHVQNKIWEILQEQQPVEAAC